MTYIFVADDFTGASDTLATLARGGMRARLFRDVPVPEQVEGLDAWGIATHARSLDRDAIRMLAARISTGLAAFRPSFLHLKVCSTFDSSPRIGNIALLGHGLADGVGIADIAVLGGQPSLGRHAVFGTLFARGPDGHIHRIDRHPIMSIHPVTPMHEADLIRHLATLGLNGLELVPRGQPGKGFPRFYDVLDQSDVQAIGHDLMRKAGRLLVMGPSSVAEAWLATRAPRPVSVPRRIEADGPVFAFVGSRSSLTISQIAAAGDLPCLPVNPADLIENGEALAASVGWARERLSRGQNVIAYLTAENAGGVSPAALAERCAEFVVQVMKASRIGGLVVAGGDTSSAIVRRLSPSWLDHAGEVCPGVPVLYAKLGDRGIPLILKGGQMGGSDFFQRAVSSL